MTEDDIMNLWLEQLLIHGDEKLADRYVEDLIMDQWLFGSAMSPTPDLTRERLNGR